MWGNSVESIEGIDTKENDVWVALVTRFGAACECVFVGDGVCFLLCFSFLGFFLSVKTYVSL